MTLCDPEIRRIVVVGAGLAASQCIEQLRAAHYGREIVLVGDEPHLPYDRPPLSKSILRGEREESNLGVAVDELNVDVRLSTRAVALDGNSRTLTVQTADGTGDAEQQNIDYDKLIIATGSTPVPMPGPGRQFMVRTIEDAMTLRTRLTSGARVIIVGAGWIGAEVATAAVAAGCTVTCLEYGSAPASAKMGVEVCERFIQWWDGVDLRLETPVAAVLDDAVVLHDGTSIACDVVVTGAGVRPCTDWLATSGLDVDRGVVVDEWLRATPDVVATGDVAARWSPRYRTRMRIGHWDNALTGGAAAATAALRSAGDDTATNAYDPVPYFWSDQFGHKVQYLGYHDADLAPIIRDPEGLGWSAAWLDRDGVLVAVLAVDRPREIVAARRALATPTKPDPERLADPEVSLKDL